MSENLDRVCEWASERVFEYCYGKDEESGYSMIAALRAEFAELERKAEALDVMREWLVAHESRQNNAWDKARRYAFEETLRKIDSLAKGGRDADDVP